MDKGRLAENLLCFAFTREKASAVVGDMLERSTSLWHLDGCRFRAVYAVVEMGCWLDDGMGSTDALVWAAQ